MAGHSKWATTHRHKAVVDAKRGAVFTKLGNMIAIAARAGTDPAMNPSLAMVLEKARQANMPNDNIKRAIARAAEKNANELIEETYEAYGPSGIGIIIEVATDNRNRTFPEVKAALTKNGGRIAESGSVAFQFKRQGVIEIEGNFDEIFMTASEVSGVLDVQDAGENLAIVYTESKDLMKTRAELIEKGLEVKNAELQYVPQSMIEMDEDAKAKAERLLDAIDDLDDVTAVHTNASL
ncbi:YebC/PmpR family DNA-binding transcriptional regulator [Candidatus Saccharibacteria bacterium]|nr:YebC/PmpR family DNA-binding transcriptional regulator [Candidatus Saccharibacteria bacterium]